MKIIASNSLTLSNISDGTGIANVTNFYLASNQSTGIEKPADVVNLIRNGAYPTNTNYWSGAMIVSQHGFYYNGQKKLFLLQTTGPSEIVAATNRFDVKRNTNYSLSFYALAAGNVKSSDVFFLGRKSNQTNDFTSANLIINSRRFSGSKAEYVTITFNSGDNDNGYIRFDNNGSSDGNIAVLYFGEVMLVEGREPKPWVAAIEDSGWTRMPQQITYANRFLWNYRIELYTDGITKTIEPAVIGVYGDKGDTGASGRDGIAGNDGKGIKATAITYQASTNGTTAPTGTWSASVPTVAKGSFLWTRTIWTYTDNTTETGYAVAYMGTNGNNGNDGIAGKDGVGIKTTTITYAGSTSGTTVPNSGWTSTVPTVAAGNYLWTKTVWAYTDNTSETGYSVGKMGNTGPAGPAGSDGNPGKIVSDTEPTTKFVGLTWKYSGVVDMTLGDSTKILAGTEYYWNGTAWALYEINAHNINGDNLSVTNGTFKDGKIESIWGGNGVNGTTTIEGRHLQIYSSDSTNNTENTIALDNLQGFAQVYTDHNTGRNITVQASFRGFFVSDSTGPYVRVTPNGISTSSDKSYNSFQIGAGITINLERRGYIVEATLSGSIDSSLTSGKKFTVGTIPVGYRPNRPANIMVHMTSSVNSSHIDVGIDGVCTWWGNSTSSGAPRGTQTWFTDDPTPQ